LSWVEIHKYQEIPDQTRPKYLKHHQNFDPKILKVGKFFTTLIFSQKSGNSTQQSQEVPTQKKLNKNPKTKKYGIFGSKC
jgi:hypothetical protein